jgi:hypothetical protein
MHSCNFRYAISTWRAPVYMKLFILKPIYKIFYNGYPLKGMRKFKMDKQAFQAFLFSKASYAKHMASVFTV